MPVNWEMVLGKAQVKRMSNKCIDRERNVTVF